MKVDQKPCFRVILQQAKRKFLCDVVDTRSLPYEVIKMSCIDTQRCD